MIFLVSYLQMLPSSQLLHQLFNLRFHLLDCILLIFNSKLALKIEVFNAFVKINMLAEVFVPNW